MRLFYVVPLACGFAVIVSYLRAGQMQAIVGELVLGVLSIMSMIAGGYVLNDVCDVMVDRINHPERELVKGGVNPKIAVRVATGLFVMGMILSWFCGWRFFVGIGVVSAGLIFYDIYSKRLGFFKVVMVAALTSSLYPLAFAFAEAVVSPRLKSLYIFPAWLFLSSLSYEMLKDHCDVKGDGAVFAGGIAAVSGKEWFVNSARIIAVFAGLVSIVPYVLGYCQHIYLVTSVVAIALMVLSTRQKPVVAIRFIYVQIFLVTFGSLIDLLVFGP